MTDTLESKTTAAMEPKPGQALAKRIATIELASELVARADEKGLSLAWLAGPGGLLGGLTKTFLEAALEGELSDQAGHPCGPPGIRPGGLELQEL